MPFLFPFRRLPEPTGFRETASRPALADEHSSSRTMGGHPGRRPGPRDRVRTRRDGEEVSGKNIENFDGHERQPEAITAEWARGNPNHDLADGTYLPYERAGGAAYDGNDRAKGVAGDQRRPVQTSD
ncbi:hypothetical protein V1L54_01060 [Streptomyces sp. TRM 70361]|uniref:hypothetical protein n=1 Tax=Streptomyces sp. TRM 70361 TaxID=3116553 RepID=UPI002E7C40CB|nr:hypothetical protein [Streptomyces sp. TRM 70361]MEE1938020.1 hypothetical protein [Streptomyces sp. TRM 70361]